MTDPQTPPESGTASDSRAVRIAGFVGGVGVFALMVSLPPQGGMSPAAWAVAAVTCLMAVWWLTEALPVAVTALMPVALFPLVGAGSVKAAAAPYAHPLIFLFLGGFVIGRAIERWGLHRRIALGALGLFGTRPAGLVAGFMLTSAFLSMWVSNTATAVMMLPICLSVIRLLHSEGVSELSGPEDHAFSLALLLAVAYGASIGGLGTLIGTPPNALLAAFMSKTYGFEIGFARWMLVGVPLSLVMLLLAWLVLTRIAFRVRREPIGGASGAIRAQRAGLGPMSAAEKRVLLVAVLVAACWITRPFLQRLAPGLTDPGIAILGAVALFLLPAGTDKRAGIGDRLMSWQDAGKLPWGVLLLFGGGLSLAAAIQSSGLALWIGKALESCQGWPVVAIILLITAIVVFLTELTSNTATAAIFLPIVGAFAVCVSLNPLMLTVPVALAASCAFMLPVATPPNAIIFSSGQLRVPEMARAGLLLNLIAIGLIVGLAYTVLGWVFGIEPGVMPDWAHKPGS